MVFYRQLTIWVVYSAPWCWDVHFSGRHFIPDTSGDIIGHTLSIGPIHDVSFVKKIKFY
jgi:hypothetical protein